MAGRRVGGRPLLAGPAEDRAAARVHVLDVGRAVALQREHAVPVERDVAPRVLVQVVVDHRPDPDRLGDPVPLLLRQLRAGRGDDGAGAGVRLVEQRLEVDHVAAPRGQRLPVRPDDHPEADVDQRRVVGHDAERARQREELAEVQFLPRVHHVDDGGRPVLPRPEGDRGGVPRVVERAAVAALEQEGREVGQVHDEGATLAAVGDPSFERAFQDRGHLVAEEALAVDRVEPHAEAVVEGLVGAQRQLHDPAPQLAGLGIAPFEAQRPVARLPVEGRILRDQPVVPGVELLQRGQRRLAVAGRAALAPDRRDQHAEVLAPVADMAVPHDAVAERGGDVGERLADDGRADVADVHTPGHVR